VCAGEEYLLLFHFPLPRWERDKRVRVKVIIIIYA
jgi:hypothetical protein